MHSYWTCKVKLIYIHPYKHAGSAQVDGTFWRCKCNDKAGAMAKRVHQTEKRQWPSSSSNIIRWPTGWKTAWISASGSIHKWVEPADAAQTMRTTLSMASWLGVCSLTWKSNAAGSREQRAKSVIARTSNKTGKNNFDKTSSRWASSTLMKTESNLEARAGFHCGPWH